MCVTQDTNIPGDNEVSVQEKSFPVWDSTHFQPTATNTSMAEGGAAGRGSWSSAQAVRFRSELSGAPLEVYKAVERRAGAWAVLSVGGEDKNKRMTKVSKYRELLWLSLCQ